MISGGVEYDEKGNPVDLVDNNDDGVDWEALQDAVDEWADGVDEPYVRTRFDISVLDAWHWIGNLTSDYDGDETVDQGDNDYRIAVTEKIGDLLFGIHKRSLPEFKLAESLGYNGAIVDVLRILHGVSNPSEAVSQIIGLKKEV